ncbi:MAG: UbiH/UbiF/VisC/COQ6 family ubiquinone biosynthesis hydroxylase [Cocleimonas sp.]
MKDSQEEVKNYDVIINGGGMVGATLACLLAKTGRKVAVIEAFEAKPFSSNDDYDMRVSAISRASQNALIKAGGWDAILKMRASPYDVMDVWDEAGDGNVRFDASELGEPDLGHIIENRIIQLALADAINDAETATFYQPSKLENFVADDEKVTVTLDDGKEISAQLLVGADGANSQVRKLAGIDFERDDYGQSGLVAVVKTEKPHESTAWQRFQSTGPLAFLPLSDGSSSIVWTLPSDRADYFLSLSKKDFKVALAEALDNKLGKITKVGQRGAFPLKGSQAKTLISERVALVGDAAHTIHPLAGQGVNLGLKDAVELAQQLISTPTTTGDLGSHKLLRRYERARCGDNVITMRAMEGFRLLFGHSASPVKTARNFGMNLFNQLPKLKNEVIRKAMGL